MSPLHNPPAQDGSAGVEAVFAGQVDASTARADDVTLWDDDTVIVRVAVETGFLLGEVRAAA